MFLKDFFEKGYFEADDNKGMKNYPAFKELKRVFIVTVNEYWEHSGSVVGRLTQDRRAVGSSLTGVTALCP